MAVGLVERARNRLRREHRRWRVRRGFRHISGPRRHVLGAHEVCALILGKDIAFFLPELIRHHRALGVERFLYVDNGSEDGSLDIAMAEPGMTVVQTLLPYSQFQVAFRRHAIDLFIEGGWVLILDADELLDYPGSDRLPVPELTRRLDAAGHSALAVQMIDMVPKTYDEAELSVDFPTAMRACRYFDTAHIRTQEYFIRNLGISKFTAQNRLTNDDIKIFRGGIRGHLFGENCCLTKHPLVKNLPSADPAAHPHFAARVTVSDFTGLLRHYKFVDGFLARERERVAKKVITTEEPALRLRRFDAEPTLSFDTGTLRTGLTPEGLLEDGVLVAAPRAREMLGL